LAQAALPLLHFYTLQALENISISRRNVERFLKAHLLEEAKLLPKDSALSAMVEAVIPTEV
jgi:hypothetical protein